MLNQWCSAFTFGYDGPVSDVCIRLAHSSDHDQLVPMRVALWPQSSAEEHARELTQILEGNAPVTLPLVILVAEAGDRTLAGFLEADLRSHADGCDPSRPVGYIEGWYVAENYRRRASAGNSWPRQKTGHALRGALRLPRIPGLTMKSPNARTRRSATRWWTAVSITVRPCEMNHG
jgi:hypothetical protein